MSLKISFESDLKGFERVEKALKEQEKILNANADAVERLKKAQSGLGEKAFDMGNSQSMGNATKQMQVLSGAFDSLQKNQSGFRAFLNNFTEFKKELTEISKIKSNDIFQSIETNIDTLKKSLTGSVLTSKNLRQEIAQLKAEGKNTEAEKASSKLREVEYQALSERSLLQDARMQKAYRQPLLQFGSGNQPPGGDGSMAGFLTGGTSIKGLMGIFGKMMPIAGAILGAAATYSKVYDNFAFSEVRGENLKYQQESGIMGRAAQGSIGRSLMRENGMGFEGKMIERQKAGEIGGESFWDSMSLAFKAAGKGFTFKGHEQIQIELEEERAELDSKSRESIDYVSSRAKGIYGSQSFMRYEAQLGKAGAQDLLSRVNKKGQSFEESQFALGEADKYGTTFSIANTNLTRTPDELGLSKGAIAEVIRQKAYGKDAQNDMGKILHGAMAAGIPMTSANKQMLSGIIAQQAGSFAGGVDLQGMAAPMLNAMESMQASGVNLQGQDAIKGAQSITEFQQGRGQQAGTMESMSYENTLIKLGVENPIARKAIIQMLTSNKAAEAVKVVHELTGIEEEKVEAALRGAESNVKNFRKKVISRSDSDLNKHQKAFKAGDVDFEGFAASGSIKSTLAVPGMGAAMDKASIFDPVKTDELTPLTNQTTIGRQNKAEEARTETESLNQMDKIASALKTEGQDVGQKLVDLFTGYTDQITTRVREGIDDALGTLTRNKPDEKPLEPFIGTKRDTRSFDGRGK